MPGFRVFQGNALAVLDTMPSESIHCCVSSPPYFGLRDYGVPGQIGLERTHVEYVEKLVEVFRKVHRVLRVDGTVWLNLGDSYANDGKWGGSTGGKHAADLHGQPVGRSRRETGLKPKDLIGVPWRVALALQADGWYLRSDIVWAKPNPMPESVTDRPTRSHEFIFLLSKSERYHYDAAAIYEESVSGHASGNGFKRGARLSFQDGEGPRGNDEQWTPRTNSFKRDGSKRSVAHPGQTMGTHRPDRPDVAYDGPTRNRRDVWNIPVKAFPDAHFAVFPEALVEPCILAGCPVGGTVLDPFAGSGTAGVVALRHDRSFIGIDLNPNYVAMAQRRIASDAPLLNIEAPSTGPAHSPDGEGASNSSASEAH